MVLQLLEFHALNGIACTPVPPLPLTRKPAPPTPEWPWLIATMALASLLAIWALGLWHADLSVPFQYTGDANFYAALIKGLAHHIDYQHNPDLAAPLGQVLYDFPDATNDHLQLLLIKGMSLVTGNQALLLNGYFLLSFPLIAGTAFLVLRRLSVTRSSALVCAVLFTLLPDHFERSVGHLFLGVYIAVPLGALLMLRVFAGEPLWRAGGPGGRRSIDRRRALATVALCVAIAMTGTYYAAFTVILMLCAGALCGFERHARGPLLAAAAAAALIGGVMLANNLPNLVYRYEHGPNRAALARDPAQTEQYSLKLAYLLLPTPRHRIAALADLQNRYDTSSLPPQTESNTATLGFAGDAGLLALLAVLLAAVAAPGRWRRAPPRLRHAGVLALIGFLLATQGGGNSLLAYLATSALHAWARMSVFIAFFALLAVGLLLDRLRPSLRSLAPAALLVLGVLDQTNAGDRPDYAATKAEYLNDAAIVGAVEHTLQPGASVFQYPILRFPEQGSATGRQTDYDNLKPYLHSRRLRWSYGTVKGRASDWQQALEGQSVAQQLKSISLAGFSGVLVDRFGYDDAALATTLGSAPQLSRDGRWAFYDIRGFAKRVLGGLTPGQLAAGRDAVLHPVSLSPDAGFYQLEGTGPGRYLWAQQSAVLGLDSPRTATVQLSGRLSTPTAAQVRLSFPDGSTQTVLSSPQGTPFAHRLTLAGGRPARVRLSSDAPRVRAPGDIRDLHFRLLDPSAG
ncbi:MAG: hypothetical protein NVSMB51_21660 [Solirubrobacteraceae bacterium]